MIINKLINQIYDCIKTSDLDNLMAETIAYMNLLHPDYSILAARVLINDLHKKTSIL